MKISEHLWSKLAAASILSDEPIPGFPLIEIVGHHRVLIENHKGVCEYGKNMIRIRVKYGCICVSGQNLELARMDKGQLTISGSIEGVQLCRG